MYTRNFRVFVVVVIDESELYYIISSDMYFNNNQFTFNCKDFNKKRLKKLVGKAIRPICRFYFASRCSSVKPGMNCLQCLHLYF